MLLPYNEGAYGDTLICIRVEEREIERFEWTDKSAPAFLEAF